MGLDLFVDPLIAALSAIGWPFALLLSPLDEGEGLLATSAGILGILPFVCTDKVREKVELDLELTEISPTNVLEFVEPQRIARRRIHWALTRDGAIIERDRIRWPEPIVLEWCDWVLDKPDRTNFALALSSDELTLAGHTRFALHADIAEVVHRRWPNAAKRPALNVTPVARFVDDKRAPLKRLTAGEPAYLEVEARNALFGPTAYRLTPLARIEAHVPIRVGDAAAIPYLGSRDSRKVYLPLRAPVDAPDGAVTARVSLIDIFERSTKLAAASIPLVHRELPDLKVFAAVIVPTAAGGKTLKITLRNWGLGRADNIRLTLRRAPPGLIAGRKSAELSALESMQYGAIELPVTLQTEDVAFPIEVEIEDALGRPPVRNEINAALEVK